MCWGGEAEWWLNEENIEAVQAQSHSIQKDK